ncbi:MAG: hypothetical protein M1839_007487 [Geoglossum umbratile]|nr:MAG: hypothetical protein M1839_007487 [Geoglossum umbratile]
MDTKASRARRKSVPSTEHVKHRRTRSGCYTCRTRRVKCDETHPICDRCRKGGRECAYPEPPITNKSSSNNLEADEGRHSNRERSSSSEDESGDDAEDHPEALLEEEELISEAQGSETEPKSAKHDIPDRFQNQSPSRRRRLNRTISESSLLTEKSPSPSTEGPMTLSGSYLGSSPSSALRDAPLNSPSSGLGSDGAADWSHLDNELQFYLNYHRNNLTLHHYFMMHDAQDFLRTTFLDMAVKNEPLLYAVVGFSAFHYTIALPNGRIQDFLTYYNKSVSLLRRSLQKSQSHTPSTLLTILQLASIEEYLGDRVNLLKHQKAAYEILTELYDPRSVTQSLVHQVIFRWYSCFDTSTNLVDGGETVLGREWFSACQQYHLEQAERHQDDISHKIEEAIANLRLITTDMSTLFANRARGSICYSDFVGENDALARRISEWQSDIHPSLRDQVYAITSFRGAPRLNLDDIVDPYTSSFLFKGPTWPMNFVLLSWYALDLMYRYQSALALQRQLPAEAEHTALQTCQLFEAIEYYPDAPPGSTLTAAHASLAVASLFLPKDDRHITWARRKFARVEQLGYIYPTTFRAKMSELWGIPDIKNHWFPNNEGYSDIIRSIRSFADDRTSTASRGTPSPETTDMKAIFGSMRLGGRSGPHSASEQPSPDFIVYGTLAEAGHGDGIPFGPPAYWKH